MWRSLLAVVTTMISAALPPFAVGVASIQIGQSFDFGVTHLGIGIAGFYLTSALLSPAAGRCVAFIGPLKCLRVAALSSTVGFGMLASSSNALTIVLVLALLGPSNALVQPSSNQLLSSVTATKERAMGFGLVQAAIPTATLLAGALLAGFGQGSAWREAMWLVAGLTLGAQIAISRAEQARTNHVWSAPPQPGRPDLHRVGGRRLVAAMAIGASAASAAATCLPAFLADTGYRYHLSTGLIATTGMVGSLGCVGVRVLAALAAGARRGPEKMTTMIFMLGVGSAGFLMISVGSSATFAVGVVVAYTAGWGWNGLFNLTVAQARPLDVTATTGITQAGLFFGSVWGLLAFATLMHDIGPRSAWVLTACFIAIGAALFLYVRRRWLGALSPTASSRSATLELGRPLV